LVLGIRYGAWSVRSKAGGGVLRGFGKGDVIAVGFYFNAAGVTGKAVTFPFQHVRHLWHDLSRF
jgi:hypothetical protein